MSSVEVTDNSGQVLNGIRLKTTVALRSALDDIDHTSTPKTPMKHGRLRQNKVKQVLGLHGSIAWRQNYAAIQEGGVTHGSTIRNYTTPGTGAHYAEDAVKTVNGRMGNHFRKAGIA